MIDAVLGDLHGVRWPGMPDEYLLQDVATQVLTTAGHHVEREVRLDSRDRIDLLVDGTVGVECKVAGSRGSVLRQLQRYAEHERITGLILLTSKASHLLIPSMGKPVLTVFTGGVL